eukprot:370346_1
MSTTSLPNLKLNGYHVFLLLSTSTIDALLWKTFASFSGFIHQQYHFSYTDLTSALSIAVLSTIVALFVNPYLAYLRSNLSILFIQILQIIGLLMLWLIKHNFIAFVIGLSCLLNTFQLHWGMTNMMVSSFIDESKIRRQYLAIYNSNWTICTFLFIVAGYIMRYYSYWLFLQIMLITSVCLAMCSAIFLPKQKVASDAHTSALQPKVSHTSLWVDVKILFVNNTVYCLLFAALLMQFFSWGLLYVTFGPFIQQLYSLNAARFGVVFALIEGCGNVIAIFLLYVFKSGKIVVFGGVVEFISVLLIMLITNVDDLAFLMHAEYQYLMYFVIFLWFAGNECIVVGIMILNVQIAPSLQQARASGLITGCNSITNFIATLIAGPLYSDKGMHVVAVLIFAIVTVEFASIIWFYVAYTGKQRRENMKLHQDNIKT